jgi:osmotically-inducible protein OsmY
MTQFNSRLLAFILSILLVSFLSIQSVHASESGEFIDDAVITTKVKAEIFNDPSLKTFEISVETIKGVVHLSGSVSNPANIDRAVEIARSISGVKAVENTLTVK